MRGWWFQNSEGLGATGNLARAVASLFSVGGVLALFGDHGALAVALVAIGLFAGIAAVLLALAEGRAKRRERLAATGSLAKPPSRRDLAFLALTGVLALAAAALVAGELGGSDGGLLLRDTRVFNGKPRFEGPEAYPALMSGHQLPKTAPRLEAILYNGGSRRAVMTTAEFTVLEAKRLTYCGDGLGDLSVEGTYDVLLPEAPFDWEHTIPADRQTVRIPFPRQLAADEAERVAFRFGNKHGSPTAYRLSASIHYDDGRQLDLGDFLLLVPGIPSHDNAWLLARPAHLSRFLRSHLTGLAKDEAHAFVDLRYADCVRGNLHMLKAFAGEDGLRSSQLDRLRKLRAPATFVRLTSPSRRPLQLLDEGLFTAAVSFAEERLEDPRLADRCRWIAAHRTLLWARRELTWARENLDEPGWANSLYLTAIKAARESLSFRPSAQAQAVLRTARREDGDLGVVRFDYSTSYPRL